MELLERAQRIGRFGYWSYEIKTQKLQWSNGAQCIFFGEQRPEVSAEQVQRLVHPEDLERVRAGMTDAVRNRERFTSSYRIRGADGEERIIEVEADPDYSPPGEPLRIFGVVRDVTEARRRERQLTEQQKLIDLSQMPIFYWDIDHGLLHWSAGCQQLYGYSREEALGRLPHELLQTQFPLPYDELRKHLRDGNWWSGEAVQTTRDGRQVIVEVRLDPVRSDDRLLVMEDNRDVTAQRAAEHRLKVSEERLAHAASLAGCGSFDHDQTTDEIHLSHEPWAGLLPATTTLDELLRIVHPADREGLRRALNEAHDPAGTGDLECEYRIVRNTGEVRWMSVRSHTFFEGEGRKRHATRTIGAVLDVTERRTFDEQQRLLMGELNHRVRNTLSVVQAIAGQTLRRAKNPRTFVEDFKGRIQAIASAHKLLNETTWQGAHLTDLIREQLTSTCGEGQIGSEGPEVWLPPQVALNLGLVLHELGTNARKHGALSVPSGHVQVSWRVHGKDGKSVLRLTWRESGGPPVRPPAAHGFGMGLIERTIGDSVSGATSIEFDPEGLRCTIDVAL
jgi:PAS domain S-box-containing protein